MDEQDFLTQEIMDNILQEAEQETIQLLLTDIKSYIYENLIRLGIDPEKFSGAEEQLPDLESRTKEKIILDLRNLKYLSDNCF